VSLVVRGPRQIYILPNKARPCLDKKNVLLLSVHIIINLSTEHLVWNLVADKQASIQPTIVPQFLSMQGPTTLCPEQTSRPWTECVCVCVCVHCFHCEISESYSVLGGYSELAPKPPFRYISGQLLWFLTMVVKNQIPESFHLCRFKKKHQRIKHVPRFFKYTTTVLNFIEKVKWPLRYPAGSKLALSLRMNQCILLNTWNLQLFDSNLFKTMEPTVINKIKYLPNTDP
jgi:hypothetical protein